MVVRVSETSVLVGEVERTEPPPQVEPRSSRKIPSALTDWVSGWDREPVMELVALVVVELSDFCSRYASRIFSSSFSSFKFARRSSTCCTQGLHSWQKVSMIVAVMISASFSTHRIVRIFPLLTGEVAEIQEDATVVAVEFGHSVGCAVMATRALGNRSTSLLPRNLLSVLIHLTLREPSYEAVDVAVPAADPAG